MKTIKDLKPGDVFLDSLGLELTVISVEPIPFLGIPRTSPKVKIVFKTQLGNEMFMNYRSEAAVRLRGG